MGRIRIWNWVVMASADNDKKYTVLFDTSKKELLNPNQGYKKIV